MNALTTYRKLRSMTVREIRDRLRQRARRSTERGEHRRADGHSLDATGISRVAAQLEQRAESLVPGCRRQQLEALQRSFPDLHEQLRRAAKKTAQSIFDRKFRLLGRPIDCAAERIDWHRDPLTSHRWQRTFYADLKLYDLPGETDVKYVWELSRHQYLAELARAWLLTGDKRCALHVRGLLLDWIERNPLYEGINWTSGLEVAVRSISWLWTLAALATWDGWQTDDRPLLAHSLAQHAEYLQHHLSYYSSPYNHLIGEATGLLMLGTWLNGMDRAATWRRRGWEVLVEHGPRQFNEDGFCVEQATGYHFFTLGFLLQAVQTASHGNESLDDLMPTLTRALRAGSAVRQPDGRWPAIGDVDSARAMPVLADDFWDFQSLCSLGAVLCKLPELKDARHGPGAELYWLMGSDAVAQWHALPTKPRPLCTVLHESGYAVAGSGDEEHGDWLLLDAGPIADGLHQDATPSVAHGHADALQLLLFQGGRPVLSDSGMLRYAGPLSWVDHFRSPAAHNTLEVVEMPAARPAGRLAWSHVVNDIELRANLSREAWLARGTVRPGRAATIDRFVLGIPGAGVWIADALHTLAPATVRWHWHLPDSAESPVWRMDRDQQDENHLEFTYDGGALAMWSGAEKLTPRVIRPTASSPAGWRASGYGEAYRGCAIDVETTTTGQLLVVSFIGSEIMPVAVSAGGMHRVCGRRETSANLHPPSLDGAEVAWSVETPRGREGYVAGGSLVAGDPWQPLSGAGSWPALFCHLASSVQVPQMSTFVTNDC